MSVELKRGGGLKGSIANEDLIKSYAACQWWLGKRWLTTKSSSHPMKEIWSTGGWASDCELFLIGNAILELRKNGHKRIDFEAKKKEFLGKQTANHQGYLFELLASTLFSQGGNKVTLYPPSAKGFDLNIETPLQTKIRASCKVVLPSQNYSYFENYCKTIEKDFWAIQTIEQVTGWDLYMEVYSTKDLPNRELLHKMFLNNLRSIIQNKKQLSFNYNGNIFSFIYRKPNLIGSLGYSNKVVSSNVFGYSPVDVEREYRKIEQVIKKANKKMKDSSITSGQNLLIIRIPRYLAIEDVVNYFNKVFTNNYSTTSAVLFIQVNITKNLIEDTIQILNSIGWVFNTKSTYPWNLEESISMQFDLGLISQNSPELILGDSNYSVPIIKNSYIYQSAVEAYKVPLGYPMSEVKVPGVKRYYEVDTPDWPLMKMHSIPFDFVLI